MISLGRILTLASLCVVASACNVRDDGTGGDCSTAELRLVVIDKNYFNAARVEGWTVLNENLPFVTYVPAVDLLWENLDTGEQGTVPMHLGADRVHTVNLRPFRRGRYDFTFASRDVPTVGRGAPHYSRAYDPFGLHPESEEYVDQYAGYSAVELPLREDKTVEMYRLKGRLLIAWDDVPEDINRLDASVDAVYGSADAILGYDGSVSVRKSFVRRSGTWAEFMLSPSVERNGSPITLTFYDKKNVVIDAVTFDPEVLMERNVLTLIKPQYVDGGWILKVKLNDEWRVVLPMTLVPTE